MKIQNLELEADYIAVAPIIKYSETRVKNMKYPTERTKVGKLITWGTNLPQRLNNRMVLVDVSMDDAEPSEGDFVLNGQKVYILKIENIIGVVTI